MRAGDETRPVCKACGKKNRPCQWEEPHTKFKDYRPDGAASSSKSAAEGSDDEKEEAHQETMMEMDIDGEPGVVVGGGGDEEEAAGQLPRGDATGSDDGQQPSSRKNSRTEGGSWGEGQSKSTSLSSPSGQRSPASSFPVLPRAKTTTAATGVSVASLLQSHDETTMSQPYRYRGPSSQALPGALIPPRAPGIPQGIPLTVGTPQGSHIYSPQPVPLEYDEALLVHHYTEYLGRWLDCTDATRQFTLGVPEKVKHCTVLCHAVLSFAARHTRKVATAEVAYQRCIALLIERLNEDTASHDETLLCAIVILRFYEQLTVPSNTGTDQESHLAGCSAIIRSSQGHHYVDPSAPTLREAAFWVYVRQCLYTATVNQTPPNVDFGLQLHPTPGSMRDAHPLARLRLETAWANQMTWNLACIVNFCFDGSDPQAEKGAPKMRRWQELWDLVETWMKDRPDGFNAIYETPAAEPGSLPQIWFTADWHSVSFSFYHFACIMLLRYKPGPKFAIRNAGSSAEENHQILAHARAICGVCKSSPETVPLAIAVCHSIFIWGPLVFDPRERDQVVQILTDFERNHVWPTTWIVNALKTEWGISPTSSTSPTLR
ncbi:hypothetical protein BDW02DRAFT_595117 [Decorospora gaudefroyi]|uniref:Zn(2)-C6 fungal-type domain-containing protein n=1 Tax=Decorospora gaudefroyi TaxID=184978 RepID=A0A6A5KSZ6_9PLEO|nr:hypothetical protein BDW02DRAFT_595117 [Decorospora gaudefroyi]